MRYTSDNLLIKPNPTGEVIVNISPQTAGWEHIYFQARRLRTGQSWEFESGENELALVNLSGVYAINSSCGKWNMGGRKSVFEDGAHALVLPRHMHFTVTAEQGGEFVATWAATDRDIAPLFITPAQVKRGIRGGDNVSRQINDLLPPGAPVHRLVLVEVYTPSGNWSSYPPHKHDQHIVDTSGNLVEADLEEVYFFKMDRPEGIAYQRVYTDAHSPMHRAGNPIDAVMMPNDNCAVLVPEGYHPVTSWPGCSSYYLNVLAGSAQSLANQDDPNFTWVKHQYKGIDARLPLY